MRVVDKVAADNGRKRRRRARCLAAAVAAVPLVALPAIGTAAAAGTPVYEASAFGALPPGPTRVLTLSLIAGGNDDDLMGVVCEGQRTCTPVPYPYLDRAVGVADLNNALNKDAPDHQIVYGYSQGANVVGDWLKKYAGTESTPSSSALSFVLIGNPGRKYGGSRVSLGEMTPDSDYNVLDVSRQYDLSSDTPDDRSNLLAMINAYAGFSSVHPDYEMVDIYDPANYVWKDGNTTYVFVPTDRLPILGFLYSMGLTKWADSLDTVLRPAIEKAYDRSYLPAQPGLLPAEAEPEPEEAAAEPAQPPVAALSMVRSAQAEHEDDTANVMQEDAESEEDSESEVQSVVEVDLDEDVTESGDLGEDAVEAEADEEQVAVATVSASEDSDSPQPSSDADSSSSDSDTPSGSESSSDSDE